MDLMLKFGKHSRHIRILLKALLETSTVELTVVCSVNFQSKVEHLLPGCRSPTMCNSKITLCGVSDQLNHRVWVFVDHVFLVSVRFCGISLLSFNHDFDLSTPGTHAATVRTSGNKCHTLCLSVYLAVLNHKPPHRGPHPTS